MVLCSDGLTNHVSDDEIHQVATSKIAEEACQSLVKMANERGGVDNITVIVARAVTQEPGEGLDLNLSTADSPENERRIYCLTGIAPEVQAYAMARYSRSRQSMVESVRELNAQRAEQFLNTFYFQYGHRSIADLAHVAMAVENVSILAAVRVVDEQLWDGQERSTRYQDFRRTRYVVPMGISGTSH